MASTQDELVDYEEEEEVIQEAQKTNGSAKETKKGSYVGIHSTGFRDFLLKPELLRAIVDCGFEHPSEGKEFFMEISWISHFIHRDLMSFVRAILHTINHSPTRMHSASNFGHGCVMSGKVWNGKNCCFCADISPAN